jgi:hypothetical protein
VSLSQRLTRAHAAQGGVTLGPEQGELGAIFCHLGAKIVVLQLKSRQIDHPYEDYRGVRRELGLMRHACSAFMVIGDDGWDHRKLPERGTRTIGQRQTVYHRF